jgi:hypothetical protein
VAKSDTSDLIDSPYPHRRAWYDSGMAYITEFFESKSGGSSQHSTCSCGWRVSERDGARVLQLETYGSDSRKIEGKVSQSIQLDKKQAGELMKLIRRTFPGI